MRKDGRTDRQKWGNSQMLFTTWWKRLTWFLNKWLLINFSSLLVSALSYILKVTQHLLHIIPSVLQQIFIQGYVQGRTGMGAGEDSWIIELVFSYQESSGVPRNFFRGVSTNSVEDRGQRERGSGGGSLLVRGSGGSCGLVQEISFHIVKFS